MNRDRKFGKTSLSIDSRRILRNQAIDENGPGTILRDFEILLNFIGIEGIKVSSKFNLLPIEVLPQLNAQLCHPIKIGLRRPQQKSYPHINGLYLLLRATGLACIEAIEKKQFLALDQAVIQSWLSLNATERYFTLLEGWLIRGRPEILGEYSHYYSTLTMLEHFFRLVPDEGIRISGNPEVEQYITYDPKLYNVALLELFGLISVEHGKPEEGKGWYIDRVHRLPFGDALLALLLQLFSDVKYAWEYEKESEAAFGEWQPHMQAFFPEWRKNLVIPETGFVDGLYVFKVSWGKIWRRIAIPGKMDLDRLSTGILRAFDFDSDHLYYFSYKNRFGTLVKIYHPQMDEPPYATEVLIGELPIKVGTVMTYLYDFGDEWGFDVKLEHIDPVDPKITKPTILETHGESPEQYPIWEE